MRVLIDPLLTQLYNPCPFRGTGCAQTSTTSPGWRERPFLVGPKTSPVGQGYVRRCIFLEPGRARDGPSDQFHNSARRAPRKSRLRVRALRWRSLGLRGADSMSAPAEQVKIQVTADLAQEWDDADGHISILRGQCRVVQGSTVLAARQMVMWRITQSAPLGKRDRLTLYLEEDVRIEEPGSTFNESRTLVTLSTRAGVSVTVRNPVTIQPARDDAFFLRAQEHRRRSTARIIRVTQVSEATEGTPEIRSVQLQRTSSRIRRVRIRSRSGNEFNMFSRPAPNRTPAEQVTILTGGVTVLIEGLDQRIGGKPIGTIELSADRMVIWSRGELAGGVDHEGGVVQSEDEPFDVYLEGNVVIFQGDPNNPQLMRKIQAKSATFDAREKKGLLLDAELEAYLPSMKGTIRIWGERIRQLGPNTFHGKGVWITPSPFGKPGYRMQATDAFLEQRFRSSTFGAEEPAVDPSTGNPESETQNWITSLNNVFFIEDVPVFYLPYLQRVRPISSRCRWKASCSAKTKFSRAQIRTQWDLAKLFGFTQPRGSEWTLLADYLSERGPAIGVNGKYHGTNLFGIPGKDNGQLYSYFIYDHGTDDLGSDRDGPGASARGTRVHRLAAHSNDARRVHGHRRSGICLGPQFPGPILPLDVRPGQRHRDGGVRQATAARLGLVRDGSAGASRLRVHHGMAPPRRFLHVGALAV